MSEHLSKEEIVAVDHEGKPVYALRADQELTRRCHAARSDGECQWENCPQLRDGEPETTGRGCPLPWWDEDIA